MTTPFDDANAVELPTRASTAKLSARTHERRMCLLYPRLTPGLSGGGDRGDPSRDPPASPSRAMALHAHGDNAVVRRGARVLCAGRLVLDLLRLAKGIHRFIDGQEDCRFDRAERTAATYRQGDRGH